MCTKVHLVHRRDEFRASKIMQKRTLENPKIQVHWNSAVKDVLGKDRVAGLLLESTAPGEEGSTRELPVTGLFLAIGHVPNSRIFEGQLDMDAAGYLKVEPGTTRTKIPGVFAAGDVADHVYRQAVTAAGTGCMAAIDAERWLAEREG
jgi:thioredoxin reductase (NADPH)